MSSGNFTPPSASTQCAFHDRLLSGWSMNSGVFMSLDVISIMVWDVIDALDILRAVLADHLHSRANLAQRVSGSLGE